MRRSSGALLCGLLLMSGCGGGAGSSSVTIAILSSSTLDGLVLQPSGVVNTTSLELAAGDNLGDAVRFFVSFPLGAIPPGATILSATLEMRQTFVSHSPYSDLGLLVVDHLDYGGVLDAGDFDLAAIFSAFGVLSSTPALEVKALDVKSRVEADLAALRVRSQFRGRYGALTDGNVDGDFAQFPSADAAADKPLLRVIYDP